MGVELPPTVAAAIQDRVDDADWFEVLAHATGAMRLVLDKVLANFAAPASFPLPSDERSIEQKLAAKLRVLPTATLQPATQQAQDRLQAALSDRQRTYGFAGELLDPTSATSVLSSVLRGELPATLRHVGARAAQRLTGGSDGRSNAAILKHPGAGPTVRRAPDPDDHDHEPSLPGGDGVGPGQPPRFIPHSLRLTVAEVDVVDKQEVTKDEIAAASVVVDPIARSTRVFGPVALGKFGRAEHRSMAELIAELPLVADANIDQYLLATVFLAEIDRGGFAEYVLNNAFTSTHEILEDLFYVGCGVAGAIVGGAAGSAVWIGLSVAAAGTLNPFALVGLGMLGLLGNQLVLALAGAALMILLAYVAIHGSRDDIFTTGLIGQNVDARDGLTLDREPKIIFTRPHARYDVTYRWELLTTAGKPPEAPKPPAGRITEVEPLTADRNLQDKVDHIVILMQENRSFDHMLGYLSLVGDRPDVNGLNPTLSNSLDGVPFIPVPLPDSTFDQDPRHSFEAVQRQINGGAMDGFVQEFFDLDPQNPGRIMGFHPSDQVPVFDFIAREFLVCDQYHSSFAGNTWVNRTIAFAGGPAVYPTGSLITNNDMPTLHGAGVPSFFQKIDEYNATLRDGESRVEWRCYFQDFPTLPIVDPHYLHLVPAATHFRTLDRFFSELANGDLPQVSWIDPNFMDVGALGDAVFPPTEGTVEFLQTATDDHPPVDIAHGQGLIATLLFAIMASPVWEKLLLVIVYDEHGGFFDHVKPPNVGDPGPDAEANKFVGLGCRVPALVISPWVERGGVSGRLFDHCSLIKTILQRFCQRDGAIPEISARVTKADHLGFVLTGNDPLFVAQRAQAPGLPGPLRSLSSRVSQPQRGMPEAMAYELLARLGKRTTVASRRPQVSSPLTDMERDAMAAREFLKTHFAARPVGQEKEERPPHVSGMTSEASESHQGSAKLTLPEESEVTQ